MNDASDKDFPADDKAQNVADLVSSLNLGLEAAVFIDDNPVERARVSEALPEVAVPDWPGVAVFAASQLPSNEPVNELSPGINVLFCPSASVVVSNASFTLF